MSPNENDSILESHFVRHYSSSLYLLSVHYAHDKILDSRELTNTEYTTTAHEELTI